MRIHLKLCLLLITGSISFNCASFQPRIAWDEKKVQHKYLDQALPKINRCIEQNTTADFAGPIPLQTKVDSLHFNLLRNQFEIHLSKPFSFQPFRTTAVEKIYHLFAASVPRPLQKFKLQIYTLGQPIEELIPNYYRTDPAQYHQARLALPESGTRIPIVQCLNRLNAQPTKGLYHYNLVISHSHGWYYSQNFKRWEWQRPRLFSKVEDLLPFSFTIPYLIPMLERAGAVVFTTRERDVQTQEVIVDNDLNPNRTGTSHYQETPPDHWHPGIDSGYAEGPAIYTDHINPFTLGTHHVGVTDITLTASAEWIPEIPATGEYAVYITYVASPENCNAVHYRINHAGGQTDFLVNQQIGGKTWLYLGTFKFLQGFNPATGKVTVTNQATVPGQLISVDAVRFGGGMGRIERDGEISGYPHYAEAARYHLQYFGMPDSLVYNLTNDSSDYKDDYQSRPEYANYLKGKPFGPNQNRDVPGLQIPIDLSLTFHTDAGIKTDSTIGTLMIYRIIDQNLSPDFPDGTSRWANRDLGDLIQTEIVQTIQTRYNPEWKRRPLMEGDYSEARRTNMPSCLLELLSHQNFTDMQYAVDPRFRFDVARAIYKGILKFLATQHQQNFVVTPLPVTHLRTFFANPGEVTLAWRPTLDSLETTARPDRYRVYTRVNNGGFDNGQLVSDTTVTFKNIQKGTIYSYQITAVNTGGESFPSEILAVCWQNEQRPPVLIVNAFDRLAGPAIVDEPRFKGFAHFLDEGVGDQLDYGFTGVQFDFFPNSKYRTNDAPGHGSSQAYFESQIASGNTRDYVDTHGQAIQACNYSFVSASDEALEGQLIDLKPYTTLDLIFGEEKPTLLPGTKLTEPPAPERLDFIPWTPALKQILIPFLTRGGRLLASGAYVGRALRETGSKEDSVFAAKWLKIDWQTGYASRTGQVYSVDSLFLPRFDQITFNTTPHREIYAVEAPDALSPQPGAKTLMRYRDNRFSAVVGYRGKYAVLVCGFPLETILQSQEREKMMRAALRFLNRE